MPWAERLLVLSVGALLGLGALAVARVAVRRGLRRRSVVLADSLTRRVGDVAAWLFPLTGVYLALPAAGLPDAQRVWLEPLFVILLIASIALLIVRLTCVMEDVLKAAVNLDTDDNLHARGVHTQFRILRRVVAITVWVIAGASVLLQFEGFRQFGAGLLASAGIAGIVLGFAAQRTLGNLIAGFQIALAQPIRLGDVVVINDELGTVEEITLTYVVLRLWDDRRLVLPISWFLENPFANWTRRTSALIGTVFLHVDFATPMAVLRAKLAELVADHPDWDGRVAELVVFEALPSNLQLRIAVSSPSAAAAFRLRSFVREQLIQFLNESHPGGLPRTREQSARPSA